jgi:hypothetical protein
LRKLLAINASAHQLAGYMGFFVDTTFLPLRVCTIAISKVNSGIQDDTAEKKRYFYSYVKETAFTHVWLHVEHE